MLRTETSAHTIAATGSRDAAEHDNEEREGDEYPDRTREPLKPQEPRMCRRTHHTTHANPSSALSCPQYVK